MKNSKNNIMYTVSHGKVDFAALDALAKAEKAVPAENDKKMVLLVGVDFQYCFKDGVGSLGVPGFAEDVERTKNWLYNNFNSVTRVMLTGDEHIKEQIFFPSWWRDKAGKEPAPYTVITHDDVVNGKWVPVKDKQVFIKERGGMVAYCEEYVRRLGGNTIWPYHATEEDLDADIDAGLLAMVYFHGKCRKNEPLIIKKGQDPWSEMFSFVKPEWSLDEALNKTAINEMKKYNIVIFTGEAASHCAGKSVLHTAEIFAEIPKKERPHIVVFKDCMSPISGFEAQTQELYEELQKKYGVIVTDSTSFVL